MLVLLDAYPLRRGAFTWRRLVVEQARYWALALGGAVGALVALRLSGLRITPYAAYGPEARAAMVAYSFWFHPATLAWPVRLSPMYELPVRLDPLAPKFLLPVIGFAVVTALLVLLRKRWPGGLAAWVYSAVMLLPISGVVHAGFQLAHDRYSWLSGLGFALLPGGAITWVLRAVTVRRVSHPVAASALAATALVIAALGVGSWQQTRVWRDSETLWRWGLETDPRGAILAQRYQDREAEPASRQANRLAPDRLAASVNLGFLYAPGGRYAEALPLLRAGFAKDPEQPRLRTNPALTLRHHGIERARAGRLPEALFREALGLTPEDPEIHRNLGLALWEQGRPDAARPYLERAVVLRPQDAEAELLLAHFRTDPGRPPGFR